MYLNHRLALLVDSKERAYLKNFYQMMKSTTEDSETKIDKSHFERLKKLILIHIDIAPGTNWTICNFHNHIMSKKCVEIIKT